MWASITMSTAGTQVFVQWMENKLDKTEPSREGVFISFNSNLPWTPTTLLCNVE